MYNEAIKELTLKYLDGTASPAERQTLLDWYRGQQDPLPLLPFESQSEEDETRLRLLAGIKAQMPPKISVARKKRAYYYSAAAAVLLVIGLGWIALRHSVTDNLTTMTTMAGEHRLLQLADGSKVWLSAGSTITYPAVFKGKDAREVSFEGEAFFDIARDKKHPFIVHTKHTSTEVLGTTFNITALTGMDQIAVSLLTGKVVFAVNGKKVFLTPGSRVRYNTQTGAQVTEPIDDVSQILKRRDGYYEFHNMRVKDIIDDVSRNFNVHIRIEGNVGNCPFYGQLKPGEPVNGFLKKLAVIEGASVAETHDGYLITGEGCH